MIIKLAALGALGYAGYRYYEKNIAPNRREAYAGGAVATSRADTWDTIDNEPTTVAPVTRTDRTTPSTTI